LVETYPVILEERKPRRNGVMGQVDEDQAADITE
jgi:hypothetical protein